eukprot:GHUV01028619.1.p1 GENE.GHUV01028619.1~~GHUV01028619.1.p1  ORF type:complete len:147 (+),score=16.45 GHUV01028619.1:697-1137(+)
MHLIACISMYPGAQWCHMHPRTPLWHIIPAVSPPSVTPSCTNHAVLLTPTCLPVACIPALGYCTILPLAVVGMLLGIAFGAVTSWLLDNIFRDATLTTIVTLVSAYSSYYVADRLVGASGLLAVVCNGFTMSLIGALWTLSPPSLS